MYHMKQNGFALIQTMVASIIIAMVLSGVLAYQQQVTKTLTAKRYIAAVDKIEANLRIKIANFPDLYAAGVSDTASALAKCILINNNGAKTCTPDMPSGQTLSKTQFFDLTTTNLNPASDKYDDVSSLSSLASKSFWRFGLKGFSHKSQFVYFGLDGQPCATGPSAQCPIQIQTFFRPICEPFGQPCQRASQIRVRYDIQVPNTTQLRALTGLNQIVRQGSFTVSTSGYENTMRFRYRQDPNTQTQQCIAVYINRKRLVFGSCGNIYPGSPLALALGGNGATPLFTNQGSTAPANAALGEASFSNGVEQSVAGGELLSTKTFQTVPISTKEGCTFSVLGLTWVPERKPSGVTRCDKAGKEYNPGGAASGARKCGLYLSYYQSVDNSTKTGTPVQLIHNTGKVWDDLGFDWASYPPLVLLQEIKRDPATPKNISSSTTFNSQIRPPISANSVLIDSTGYKGDGFWSSFQSNTDMSPNEYYFKLEDGGDWVSGQDLSKVDFGLELQVPPHVCRHVGWEEAATL